jgi:hypothetical protein
MKTILLHLPHTPPVLATMVGEVDDNGFITVDNPLVIMEETSYVYTSPYMPFAKNNIVMIQKSNIISMADANDELIKSYKKALKALKSKKVRYSEIDDEIKAIKSKFLN